MNAYPMANAVPINLDKEKVVAMARRHFSGALANDTKWNELITLVRSFDDWKPSYRSKWVDGWISRWDTEWFYHLPFPFVGVEWFDIALPQQAEQHLQAIDYSALILSGLAQIGLEFEVQEGVVRIWGYAPKSYDDFPPQYMT